MNTNQIYEEYLVPVNLQQHMLRVASLAQILLEHWTGPEIDKDGIVQACLFHDIAKPMNFDLTKQAQFGMSPSEIDSLDRLQQRLKTNYGTNEHKATVEICKEIGCGATALRVLDKLEWSYIPSLIKASDLASLVPIYCDMRIGPKGILTLHERLDDLKARTGESEHEENGMNLEKLISQNVSMNLNSVTEEDLEHNFAQLESLSLA